MITAQSCPVSTHIFRADNSTTWRVICVHDAGQRVQHGPSQLVEIRAVEACGSCERRGTGLFRQPEPEHNVYRYGPFDDWTVTLFDAGL
jgi:hypothetical protein